MKKFYLIFFGFLLIISPILVRHTPNAVGQTGNIAYLPTLFGGSYDLNITNVILTQATQSDTNNDIPLVSGRRTLARVFVSLGTQPEPSSIVVTLFGSRDGVSIGSITSPPQPLPANPSRDNLSSTINFELPADWLQAGNLEVQAVVVGQSRNAETARSDTFSAFATVHAVPDLDVKIVPLNYNHTGPTNPGNYFTGNVDHVSDYLFRTYPVKNVNISFRAPYVYTGNLEYTGNINQHGQIWSDFLAEMASVKAFENAPLSQVYYTNVPTRANGRGWFTSGIAGIGYIGFRVSIGLDLGDNDQTGELAAHEIGHNFGRRHAPCGNAGGVDISYPYTNARIGVHGFDIVNNVLLLPQSAVRDVMSYCEPQWVSDYTYRALFEDQVANGLRTGEIGDVLLVRVRLDGEEAEFLPLYQFEGRISAESHDPAYQLQFLNADGNIIATQNVQLLEAIEKDVSHRAIVMSVPQIDMPYASLQLLEAGDVIASRAISASTRGSATVERVGDSIRVTWVDTERPHAVRVANGDGTYMLMGMDLVGGAFEFAGDGVRELGQVEVISAD